MKKLIFIALVAMLFASCGVRKTISYGNYYTVNGKKMPIQFAGVMYTESQYIFSPTPVAFTSSANSSLMGEGMVQLNIDNEDINDGEITFTPSNTNRWLYIYHNNAGWVRYGEGSYRVSKDSVSYGNGLIGGEANYVINIKAQDSLGTFELSYTGQMQKFDYYIPVVGNGKINGEQIALGYYSLYYIDENHISCNITLTAINDSGDYINLSLSLSKNMLGKTIRFPNNDPTGAYAYYWDGIDGAWHGYDISSAATSGTMRVEKRGDSFKITLRATMQDGFELNADFTGRLSWWAGEGC